MGFLSSLTKKRDEGEPVVEKGKNEDQEGVSTETTKGKALRAVNFFDRMRMEERPLQHQTKPHTPPATPSDSIPHSSYTLIDEHPGHLYHARPMTGKKTLKPPGGHKQQGQRFADDTNIGRKPEIPQLPLRPITYDGRASGRETFFASIEKKQLTAAEQEAKKIAKAKKEGAYVKPTPRADTAGGTQKENEPIGAQSSPVQMPRRTSPIGFNTGGSGQNRIPQFGDFDNIRGAVRETLHFNQDHDMGGMSIAPAPQQPITSDEASHSSQRQYSGGNKPMQGTMHHMSVIGDMGPPPVPQYAAAARRTRNTTSKQESRSRVSEWLGTDQEMRGAQNTGTPCLGQGLNSAHGKRPLDHSDDAAIMEETIHRPMAHTRSSLPAINQAGEMTSTLEPEQRPSEFNFMPHLLPGARGAARRYPPAQPEAGPGEDYEQLFNPEEPLRDPQDPGMRALAADLVDNTNNTPPWEYRHTLAIPMLNHFKKTFLDAGLPDGMLSPETHAEIIHRNANARMYADHLDKLLGLCDSIECLLYCMLPHNKRRYPAPPFCPARKDPPTFPPCPDESKLFVPDNVYDESIQLLTDALLFIRGFEMHGVSENPLLFNKTVREWFKGFDNFSKSLNRMGVLVDLIGNRCKCGQWDYVARIGEALEAIGGIWTVVTGTLRPPNWAGKVPHLGVGIDPDNIPPNSVIEALLAALPQGSNHPQQLATVHSYQQQANAADQYRATPSPAQVPAATSSGYGNTITTYQIASNPGTTQYPRTTHHTTGQYGHVQQPSSTYHQTAGHSGYNQQFSSNYQTGGNSGYGPYPGSSYQMNGNGQWLPDPTYHQPSNNVGTFPYSQQTGTTNTGGSTWHEGLPDGSRLDPYSQLNQSLDLNLG